MVLTEDFRYPGVSGKKPKGLGHQQWFSKRIFLMSANNEKVYSSFIDVMNLKKSPTTLLHPYIIKEILVHTFSKKHRIK